MDTIKWRIVRWAVWFVMAVLGLVYVLELVREGRADAWEPGMYGFHFGVAALLWSILALLGAVIGRGFLAGGQRTLFAAVLYWTPRTAAVLFTLLIGVLGLDVFSAGGSLGQMLLAFLMHSIPALIFAAAVAAAWRWEWVGTLLFCGWGVFYVLTAGGFPLSVYVEIAALPFAFGVLYWFNWQKRRAARAVAHAAAQAASSEESRSPADE